MKIIVDFGANDTPSSIERKIACVVQAALDGHAQVRLEKSLGLEKLYTARELAETVGFSESFWRRQIMGRGLVPVVRLNNKTMAVAESDVNALVRRYKLRAQKTTVLDFAPDVARERFQRGGR